MEINWTPARVGCHWHLNLVHRANVSTTSRTIDGKRFSGYSAMVDFKEIGTFPTRESAQRATLAHIAHLLTVEASFVGHPEIDTVEAR